MLRVEALETGYGQSQVLFGIDLEVHQGEMVTLLGRNGMGKTTTIRSIMGLTRPRRGTITLHGQPTTHLAPHEIARRGIGLVPEGRGIFPSLTVWENLTATARPSPHGNWTPDRILALFPWIADRRHQMGGQLSGGEQQMLAIGRALMTNPALLILDEATEGLSPIMRRAIWKILRQLKAGGQSILIVDKNLQVLARLADRHYVLEKGSVRWRGDRQDLRSDFGSIQRMIGV